MKERKETINIGIANLVSIGILAVSAFVLYGVFFLIWDYQDWFNKEKLNAIMDQFITNYIMFMVALIVGIMVVWKLRKENPENMVLDHPTEAGYLVYEEDNQ